MCLPHGGGSAQAYRDWPELLPDWIEVLAIAPPGRGARLKDPPIDDMAVLADRVSDALLPQLDLPFVLFGHSVGALVAFEVALRLTARGLVPLHVIVSGHRDPGGAEPGMVATERPIGERSDDELMAEIARLGLLPADVLAEPELRALVLPPVRTDFQLAQGYRPARDAALACPLTAIGGCSDPIVPLDQLDGWRIRTRTAFAATSFPGGHFFTETSRTEVLAFIAELSERALGALPASVLLGDAEDYPLETCLHDLYRHQAALTPDALALSGPDRDLTFAELDRDSDLLAHTLLARGCRVDETVAILMETSADYVVAVLAILKAGGAYLPIPLVTPDRAIGHILETMRPVAVVTRPLLAGRLSPDWQSGDRCIVLGEGWPATLAADPLPWLDGAETQPSPDSLAYCVMTSGTTGAPKGIACPHRGAVNSYWWRFRHLPYGEQEREACNVFFVWEVLRPLLQGRPAYVIPDDVIFDPRRLVQYLERHQITRVLFTPSLIEQVLNACAGELAVRLAALRMLILNGEVVSLELCERLSAALPHVTIVNDYSISECHDVATSGAADQRVVVACRSMPAGRVMGNVRVYILDDDLRPVPWGVPGEVYVAGPTLARGYLGMPEETAARFLPDPFEGPGARMFRTGDVGRALPDGQLEVRGRARFMVKLRGYSIVPSAVEAAIAAHPGVGGVAVVPVEDPATGQPIALAAYVAGRSGALGEHDIAAIRADLKERLPGYAIPAHFVPMAALPIQLSTGKIDRRQLPPLPTGSGHEAAGVDAGRDQVSIERRMRAVWLAVLGQAPGDAGDNFFDLGGHSLLAIRLALATEAEFGTRVDVVDVFNHPEFGAFCRHVVDRGAALPQVARPQQCRRNEVARAGRGPADIAVIAMGCRFPMAATPEALWRNLCDGRECLTRFSDADLRARGVPGSLLSDPRYVRAGAVLEGVDLFDAAYFGLSAREAVLMDPQQRLFLECCAETLAACGEEPRAAAGKPRNRVIGIWAGCYLPTYLVHHLGAARHLDPADPTTFHLAETGNASDYLATRAAYLLDLTGPAIAVQTSCSTGLVAIAEAAAALAAGRCDMALAGAASITFPQAGYLAVEGHIGALSGRCRTFDSSADGTILGDGVGVVALRRLEDAIADGDDVMAVITGYGVNNDGAAKAGYSAPSGIGQAAAIRAALDMAGLSGADIGYVEAHGTATIVGDPIEVRALADAFASGTGVGASGTRGSVVLGSIKANIGHSNIAAGVAGFIKTVAMLRHRHMPPQINLGEPNPRLGLDETPFRIETTGGPWAMPEGGRRRAGVSSFGIGGTNAHVVLGESLLDEHPVPSRALPPPRFDRRRHWPGDDVALHAMDRSARGQRPQDNQRPDHKQPWPERFYTPSLLRLSKPAPLAADAPQPQWLVLAPPPPHGDSISDEVCAALTARGQRVWACRSLDAGDIAGAIDRAVAASPSAAMAVRLVTTWHLARRQPDVATWLSPIILLAHVLQNRRPRHPIAMTVLAQDERTVVAPTGCGPFHGSTATTLAGVLASLQQEDPTIETRIIDVGAPTAGHPDITTPIIEELTAAVARPERLIAIRQSVRWTERFDPLTLGDAQRDTGRRLLRRGPHIITGGRGRIGRALAAHLANLGADVVLVSRRASAEASIDPHVSHVTTDVTDEAAMRRLVLETRAQHGRIGCIFHAAGLAKLENVADVTPDSLAAELAPKVAGTKALVTALTEAGDGKPGPDVLVLFSSLAATLGGIGLGAYAAANRHLDAVAQDARGNALGFPVVSIGFDDWDFDYGDQQQASYAVSRRGLAIAPEEGIAAIEAILGELDLPRVLVSATPLGPRIERWVNRPPMAGGSSATLDQTPAGAAGQTPAIDQRGGLDLDDETRVRAAYEAVLGCRDMSADDDFFDLGGDSLLATEVVLAISRNGGGDGLRITDVLDHPSIRALARCLAARGSEARAGEAKSDPTSNHVR